VTEDEKQDPNFQVRPRYWVPQEEVEARLNAKGWDRPWLLGWRDICRATDERTVIASVFPRVGVGNTVALAMPASDLAASQVACLLANLSALVLDFVARLKIGGTHLNFYLAKQLAVLPPTAYPGDLPARIAIRVAALYGPSGEMEPFRREVVASLPTSVDEPAGDRQVIRAELDALFARAYGLNRQELRYVLDPKDLHGEDYPSETFRVLKDGEMRTFGEYRTQRLVLEAWDRLVGTA
jgi:hypothetical protein